LTGEDQQGVEKEHARQEEKRGVLEELGGVEDEFGKGWQRHFVVLEDFTVGGDDIEEKEEEGHQQGGLSGELEEERQELLARGLEAGRGDWK
jgi:hypothetical protein